MLDFIKNKKKWSKYYDDLKSFFSPRFLNDAIIPTDVFKSLKFVTKERISYFISKSAMAIPFSPLTE